MHKYTYSCMYYSYIYMYQYPYKCIYVISSDKSGLRLVVNKKSFSTSSPI